MKTVAYLNRWNELFHLMLAVVDANDGQRRIRSQFFRSLANARRVLNQWQMEYAIASADLHDNSEIDLDVLFAQMDVDLEGVAESEVAGVVQ